ncbi:UNVERIFIED_CONTAM: hypothetical protein Q9R58_12130 [Methylobacteriaceae bacterium AG10]|nr:hypothetical protein [Methylobacteriaceae bacterium AG10]
MPRKLPGPLIEGLLAVAEQLAQASGAASVRQASMRRGVSSAYYALFHALCTLSADELVGWSKMRSLPPIYRSLDHGVVLKKLRSQEARLIDPSLETVGALFQNLQEKRHAADYAPPSALFSRTEALALIDEARDAIALIEGLDSKARLHLAILLLARQRAA